MDAASPGVSRTRGSGLPAFSPGKEPDAQSECQEIEREVEQDHIKQGTRPQYHFRHRDPHESYVREDQHEPEDSFLRAGGRQEMADNKADEKCANVIGKSDRERAVHHGHCLARIRHLHTADGEGRQGDIHEDMGDRVDPARIKKSVPPCKETEADDHEQGEDRCKYGKKVHG